MTLTTSIIYYLMALTGKINGLLGTMENSTNLLLIPIALIVFAFVCRWHTAFVESQLKEQDRTISNLKDQIDGRDAALRGSTIEYKKLYQQIQILQENLTRSNSDRLSELTSIMRMVQALESIPMLDRLSGAIHLIKRVIYDAICKLDPSQAVDP